MLTEVCQIFMLVTNFMISDERVKLQAVSLGIADLVHKFWTWISFKVSYLVQVMKMLCTYTTECEPGKK